MKSTVTARIILAAMLLSTAAAAAENPPGDTPPPPAPAKTAATQPHKAETGKNAAAKKSPDSFVPTEKLSHDLSASFPADI
jgi:hypothetical protein